MKSLHAVFPEKGRPQVRFQKKSYPLKAPQNEKGLSAAHKRSRLSLLPSGPDEVHGLLLRRTPVTLTKPSKDNCIVYYIIFCVRSSIAFLVSRNFLFLRILRQPAPYTAFFRRRTPERKPASILPVSQRRRSLILLLASSAEIPLHRSPVPPEILPLPVCCRRLRRLEDNSSF